MSDIAREEPVLITSCKSNLGHCEGSAGVSGFLKCVVMGMTCECCPNVHLNCYNAHLDLDGFPGIFLSECLTERYDTSINGVLSFGFGGTNACSQVWGQNVMTSRGLTGMNTFAKILDKIAKAPPH